MSTETKVTVAGWVGTQPKHFVSENGTDFTSFRLASTRRYYNRAEDRWVDGVTTWFTVKAWRATAINVAESLRKSDPVVVHGALTSDDWASPEGPRTTLVIEADALGPDLSRGQATFRHTVHPRTVATDGATAGPGTAGSQPSNATPDDASGLLGTGVPVVDDAWSIVAETVEATVTPDAQATEAGSQDDAGKPRRRATA